ncbi:protein APCDD1-like [Penaeus chinensis]|uniref:protein APCDD1-like n=1 Tax=Penaeus chinensis TaxID=139456 RepID=UPI001FB7AFE9|nr:protein APCDD1-like [Penaeus chinensis]
MTQLCGSQRRNRDVPYINVELWALSAEKSFCETRPGPQYVLRAYNFHRDGTFHLALHFYRDPHCAHPAHSLAAHGHLALGRPSWVTPGGTEAEYTLSRVEVVAHTHRDAAMVAAAVNASCPGKVTKPWKPHKAHTVLAYTETGNHVTEDEDCGRGLGGAWHELQLLRVEETSPLKLKKDPSSSSSSLRMRRELFLGDLHTDLSKQDIYRPTGFQQPLLNTKYVSDYIMCNLDAQRITQFCNLKYDILNSLACILNGLESPLPPTEGLTVTSHL